MPALTEAAISKLLEPYLAHVSQEHLPGDMFGKLSDYLDLLLRWNARTNLTAIRDPEQIVQRHFGESLFTGTVLRGKLSPEGTLLDFGSGAGFPGVPIQILMPGLSVCLGESQGKKASFLREAVRTLKLGAEVWAGRIEDMPEARKFDCVALRAVDNMKLAVSSASARVRTGGWMAILGAEGGELPPGLVVDSIAIPGGENRFLQLIRLA